MEMFLTFVNIVSKYYQSAVIIVISHDFVDPIFYS